MPAIHLQEKNRIYLGDPYTSCINSVPITNNYSDDISHHTYDAPKCNAKRLYKKIYQTCNCILRYIFDIEEYFHQVNEYRIGLILITYLCILNWPIYDRYVKYLIKKQSSCSMLQHVECVSPIVQKWDWSISHHCPESCSSHFFIQRDIQVYCSSKNRILEWIFFKPFQRNKDFFYWSYLLCFYFVFTWSY